MNTDKRKMWWTVKVAVHIFRDAQSTSSGLEEEQHLEAVVDVLDEKFDCLWIVKYDLAPESFNASEFAKANAKALRTAVKLAAHILDLKIESPFNISRVVGIVAVIEDKIALDLTEARCLAPNIDVSLRIALLGFIGNACICTKRNGETYKEYASRRLAERIQEMPATVQKFFSVSLGYQ